MKRRSDWLRSTPVVLLIQEGINLGDPPRRAHIALSGRQCEAS
jgi:hypothetical protein